MENESVPGSNPEIPETEALDNEVVVEGADATGASEQEGETEEQRQQRVSDAAKTMAEQRKQARENAQRRLQEDRDEWRNLAKSLAQREQQAPRREVQQEAPREPTANFDPSTGKPYEDFNKFVEDRAEWKARQEVERHFSALQERAAQQAAMLDQQRIEHEARRRNRDFAARTPDFAEVTNQDIIIPPAATRAIQEDGYSAHIVYALGKSPELLATIQNASPWEQVKMVGKLSAWFATEESRSRNSNAAPAGRGVRATGGSSEAPPSDPDDYEKWAAKNIDGKRKRG